MYMCGVCGVCLVWVGEEGKEGDEKSLLLNNLAYDSLYSDSMLLRSEGTQISTWFVTTVVVFTMFTGLLCT